MFQEKNYYVLAYYYFVSMDHPHEEVAKHKAFFEGRDAACRIYISEQGINGQLSAVQSDAEAYMEWMNQREEFKGIRFKIHKHHENVFPRITIKYRKQLVALDLPWRPGEQGKHVSPREWQQMLEAKEEKILIDVRNEYEWKVGHFAGAELPPCETFREFSAYADNLKEKHAESKPPVMMYCTGGIRCELYSTILKEKGFENVYQLDGGVIGYGLEQGNKHWLGKLFVFDDRMAVPIADQEAASPIIGKCHHCGTENEQYYNCSNIDCNHLFLCCPDCLKQFSGCCCSECVDAPRQRPFHEHDAHKPFRRWHEYRTKNPSESSN